MENRRGAYRVLVGRPQERNPLGIPRFGRGDIIKTDFQVVGWRSMDWIDMAQGTDRCRALVNEAMKFRLS
jgi:hypothetical protein